MTETLTETLAHAQPALGRLLPLWSVTPFVLMLLGIALVPLQWPHFWERDRNKAILSAVLGLPVALYVGVHDATILSHTALEYANSYIGNGPNFMVKAIAEEQGISMPSFVGYMAWSGAILLPIFTVITFVFFL